MVENVYSQPKSLQPVAKRVQRETALYHSFLSLNVNIRII